jgi:hypothetical protein
MWKCLHICQRWMPKDVLYFLSLVKRWGIMMAIYHKKTGLILTSLNKVTWWSRELGWGSTGSHLNSPWCGAWWVGGKEINNPGWVVLWLGWFYAFYSYISFANFLVHLYYRIQNESEHWVHVKLFLHTSHSHYLLDNNENSRDWSDIRKKDMRKGSFSPTTNLYNQLLFGRHVHTIGTSFMHFCLCLTSLQLQVEV